MKTLLKKLEIYLRSLSFNKNLQKTLKIHNKILERKLK